MKVNESKYEQKQNESNSIEDIEIKNSSNKEKEEEIKPKILEIEGEIQIKDESDIEEEREKEEEKEANKQLNFDLIKSINEEIMKGRDNILRDNELEKIFTIHLNTFYIKLLLKLSYDRFLVLDEIEVVREDGKIREKKNEVRIYSLKTGKCLTKIEQKVILFKELKNNDLVIVSPQGISLYKLLPNQNYELYQTIGEFNHEIKQIMELKNKDLMLVTSYEIFFFKLLQNQKYELYQIINEFNQGTNKIKLLWVSDKEAKEYYNINSISELMNGDLISCNSYGIKIYKEDKDGKYNLYFKKDIGEEVIKIHEIRKNILIIFKKYYKMVSHTFQYEVFSIYKYNIDNNELILLNQSTMSDRNFQYGTSNMSYLILNNNYLIARYGFALDVYDISQDFEFILPIKYNFFGDGKCIRRSKYPISDMLFTYEGDIFVAEDDDYMPRFFAFKNNIFIELKNFPFMKKDLRLIKKMDDNHFIIYNNNCIIIVTKYN